MSSEAPIANPQSATANPPSGIFNINKPRGMTSHDVVAIIRRLTHPRAAARDNPQSAIKPVQNRVGHAGTLDPMATGVLPIVLGKATRLVEYLADADKAYRATLALGATSDTYDAEGTITPVSGAPMPSRAQVEAALQSFRGDISQLPPMHSAIKVGGKKLYELARAGIQVERQLRPVTITRLDLEGYDPLTLQLFIECSKGTYIRSLAHDLGAALGTGAYLAALTRTRHGPFTLDTATSLADLEEAFTNGTWHEKLYPPEYILVGWRTHLATPEQRMAIAQGKPLMLPGPGPQERPIMQVTTPTGELLAIMYWNEKGFWHPQKVFIS